MQGTTRGMKSMVLGGSTVARWARVIHIKITCRGEGHGKRNGVQWQGAINKRSSTCAVLRTGTPSKYTSLRRTAFLACAEHQGHVTVLKCNLRGMQGCALGVWAVS